MVQNQHFQTFTVDTMNFENCENRVKCSYVFHITKPLSMFFFSELSFFCALHGQVTQSILWIHVIKCTLGMCMLYFVDLLKTIPPVIALCTSPRCLKTVIPDLFFLAFWQRFLFSY